MLVIFLVFTYKFYKSLTRHHFDRLDGKLNDLQMMFATESGGGGKVGNHTNFSIQRPLVGMGIQGVEVV